MTAAGSAPKFEFMEGLLVQALQFSFVFQTVFPNFRIQSTLDGDFYLKKVDSKLQVCRLCALALGLLGA